MKESKEDIEAREAFERHNTLLALRWFGYYKLCKDKPKQAQLLQQYNKIATQRCRDV